MKIDYSFVNKLIKPNFQPPAWVFRLIWPILYLLMFISFYTYMTEKTSNSKDYGVLFFIIQLLLNFLWTSVFFGLKKIGTAGIVAILLFLFAIAMVYEFGKISAFAAYLNIPYLLWLFFAIILNIAIWKKN